MANIKVALGCESKFKIVFSGTQPDDLTTPFDTANWTLSAAMAWQGSSYDLGVSVTDEVTIMITVDQNIIGLGDIIPQQSYTMGSLPACPANVYGVSKLDGKRYCLASFTIQFVPRY